ncbi:MAG: hypothetical protein R2715_14725 [Ilumatobacteraceae bacterium]
MGADDRLRTSSRRADAVEVGLRARVLGRVPLDEGTSWYRAYGAPDEDPAATAATIGIEPVTAATLGEQQRWEQARAAAVVRRAAAELEWMAGVTVAIERARREAAAGLVGLELPLLDPVGAVETLNAAREAVRAEPDRIGRVEVVTPSGAVRSVEIGEPQWMSDLRRWTATIDSVAAAGDPVAALLDELEGAAVAAGRTRTAGRRSAAPSTDGLLASLDRHGARATGPARSWTLDVWRSSLAGWDPAPSDSPRTRRERLAQIGIELGGRRTDAGTPAGPGTDPTETRLRSLDAALAALADPPPRPEDAEGLDRRIRLLLWLLVPLGGEPDSWVARAVRAGIPVTA